MLNRGDAEHLALMATRAPSVHNTQPWRLVVRPDLVEVFADRTRQLPVLDPLGRQLHLSCGALVHHLEAAAGALGYDTHEVFLPEGQNPDLVARIRLRPHEGPPRKEDVQLTEAVLRRATNRRRFVEGVVTEALVDVLRRAVQGEGASLFVLHEDERLLLDSLVEHAEQALLRDPRYRAELRDWVFDPARAGERDDGIPVSAVDPGAGRAEELPGRRFLPGGSSEHLLVEPEHPTVVVLTTPTDEPSDWLRAGMALSSLLLHAEQEGLVAQPVGQATDLAHWRATLRRELGLVGVPQLVLRVGQALDAVGLQTPRRPVEQVLTWEGAPAVDSETASVSA